MMMRLKMTISEMKKQAILICDFVYIRKSKSKSDCGPGTDHVESGNAIEIENDHAMSVYRID